MKILEESNVTLLFEVLIILTQDARTGDARCATFLPYSLKRGQIKQIKYFLPTNQEAI